MGVPAVAVVTTEFLRLAQSLARTAGYPDLRILVVPHPFETKPIAEIEALADERASQIVNLLTGMQPTA